ncbi:hypothetical protein NE237_008539 [Protea cynaroides]|uniref:Uncharacterized protein n=1 Tax=Protea cynaroides TaxID=273540 RepID=A0A9Q0QZS6_9MAGN|nr:hypothetical protein NE237_008539 [Protea cynaroides]
MVVGVMGVDGGWNRLVMKGEWDAATRVVDPNDGDSMGEQAADGRFGDPTMEGVLSSTRFEVVRASPWHQVSDEVPSCGVAGYARGSVETCVAVLHVGSHETGDGPLSMGGPD